MNETKITTNNFTEAHEDARRLTKVLGRGVEPKPVRCCEYEKNCGRCFGNGLYYELVYSSCGHSVQDDNDIDCEIAECAHKELLASIEREELNDLEAA